MFEFILTVYFIICVVGSTYTVDKFIYMVVGEKYEINIIDIFLFGSYLFMGILWAIGTGVAKFFKMLSNIVIYKKD